MHRIISFLLITLWMGSASAAKLPGFFTDHMVLQRDRAVPIWGWGEPGEEVTVRFAGQETSTKVTPSGEWRVTLDPMPASLEGQALEVNQLSLTDVVVGDVWICSGQSNMEWSVAKTGGAKEFVAASANPAIRHIKIPRANSAQPLSDAKGTWQVAAPGTTGNFTAVGYHFARRLQSELAVPIGLIGTNWGGTKIEPWVPPVGFAAVPELQEISDKLMARDPSTPQGKAFFEAQLVGMQQWVKEAEVAVAAGRYPGTPPPWGASGGNGDPARLYNGMIHPLVPFAIRGAIWYQGESNGSEGESYFHKKQALIQGWRKLWGQGDFPFYFVQLANFRTSPDTPSGGDGWAALREAQRDTLSLPNTGMAVIIDIGAAKNIHPTNKFDVGSRLAQWALAKEYGKDIVPSGPLNRELKVEGATIRVTFDHVGEGLMVGTKKGMEPTIEEVDGVLKQFAIAGADKQWHWAEAKIDGDTVVVSSPHVAKPVAVRYAYRMNPVGANLYNQAGLPASPFRTDDW